MILEFGTTLGSISLSLSQLTGSARPALSRHVHDQSTFEPRPCTATMLQLLADEEAWGVERLTQFQPRQHHQSGQDREPREVVGYEISSAWIRDAGRERADLCRSHREERIAATARKRSWRASKKSIAVATRGAAWRAWAERPIR